MKTSFLNTLFHRIIEYIHRNFELLRKNTILRLLNISNIKKITNFPKQCLLSGATCGRNFDLNPKWVRDIQSESMLSEKKLKKNLASCQNLSAQIFQKKIISRI